MLSPFQSLGIPLHEIKNKKHNLWIGVSFGNRSFTPKNVERLIGLGLKLTRSKLLIWLPGRMHAINLRYMENLSRAKALKKGFAEEAKQRQIMESIVNKLPKNLRSKVVIANYDDVCTPKFIRQREILYKEFGQEGEFYNDVIEVVREIVRARKRTETKDRLESLALYVMQELPLFLDGLKTTRSRTVYTAILYPGFGKLDHLVDRIKTSKKYSGLRKKLKLETVSGIVDVSLN